MNENSRPANDLETWASALEAAFGKLPPPVDWGHFQNRGGKKADVVSSSRQAQNG
jgi:hypothetical protein